MKYKIKQIKGKQNKPVTPKYQPHVRDFLTYLQKKNKIADIESYELHNIGLIDIEGKYYELHDLPPNIKIKELKIEEDLKLPSGIHVDSLIVVRAQVDMPPDITVDDYFSFASRMATLPKSLLESASYITLRDETMTFPAGVKIEHIEGSACDLTFQKGTVIGSIYMRNLSDVRLPTGLVIEHEADLSGSNILGFGSNIVVDDLNLNNTRIKKLPQGLQVDGTLRIRATDVRRLPDDLVAGIVVADSGILEDYRPPGVKYLVLK